MNLTDSQRRAIQHDCRNLQLIACAGSGKTEVVARRMLHLLALGRPNSLKPANIFGLHLHREGPAELKGADRSRTREALGDIPGMAEMFGNESTVVEDLP